MSRPERLLEPCERLSPRRRAWLAVLVVVQAAVLGAAVIVHLARVVGS